MNAMTPPPLASGNYASTRVEETIAISPNAFLPWYIHEPIENFMKGTLVAPPITGTEPLPGPDWGEAGAARKIFFKDGTTSLERIVETDFPRSYKYQPWAYTSPVRFLSGHAVSTMSALPDGAGTRIVWDYGFHAKNGLAYGPLALFVRYDWARNLKNALVILKKHLETHGTAKRIHEA